MICQFVLIIGHFHPKIRKDSAGKFNREMTKRNSLLAVGDFLHGSVACSLASPRVLLACSLASPWVLRSSHMRVIDDIMSSFL